MRPKLGSAPNIAVLTRDEAMMALAEIGPADSMVAAPKHPYAQALVVGRRHG